MSRPRRSALYMPASNSRAIEKARGLPCDVVILDLEDAVAPEEKARARENAVAAVRHGGFGGRELAVRVNGLETEWGADDLAAIAEAGPDVVLVPKIASVQSVEDYSRAITAAPETTMLWAMIETCSAIFALEAIAAASATTRLRGFVMGTNDLAKEMRATLRPGRAPLLPILSLAVAAARIHGLVVLDGVFNALDDEAGLAAACAESLEFGFDGRTLIHPNQIAVCNRAFTPTPEQAARAQAIVDAFGSAENAGRGALRVNGAMVERLHLEEARRVLAYAHT